jgi:hypothetical protein
MLWIARADEHSAKPDHGHDSVQLQSRNFDRYLSALGDQQTLLLP